MQRRHFLKAVSPLVLLLANRKLSYASPGWDSPQKRLLRFAVASDGHYGQEGTPYRENFRDLVQQINREQAERGLDYCVINGDIIHNDPSFLEPARDQLKQLKMPFGVTQGNHDMVTADVWADTWGMPVNHHHSMGEQAFLMATTSNVKGEYLCPDLSWLGARLEEYKGARHIFLFLHITPAKWTTHGIDCPEFFGLLKRYGNVRAVFNGHDHDQDDVKTRDGTPFLFSAHFGGNWGTPYKGFRVVELLEDQTLATYILNPQQKINERKFGGRALSKVKSKK